MEEKIIELLKENLYLSINDLSKLLDHHTTIEFKDLIKALNYLEDKGKIVRNEKNEYILIDNSHMVVGTLEINKRGFGFVSVDEESEDIFIAQKDLKDAFHQDQVLVEIKKKQTGTRKEGRIIRVLERGQTRLVGVLKKAKRELVLVPDDKKFTEPVYIDHAHLHGAMPGHKVVVDIKTYKPYIKGDVIQILGHELDPGVDILSVVAKQEAHFEFPKKVFEQIDTIETEIDQNEANHRTDLRAETIVTIDGDDAKDLDDAISLKKLSNGHYYLGVHIADVSYYVRENTPLDQEAFERGTSIYLVDRVIPMLPHKLSNGICSLNPHVDRLAISCFMEITPQGDVIDHEILETVINSTERMTYHNVNAILDGDEILQKQYAHVVDLFFLMQELALILQKKREERGAIDFDTHEAKVIVDKKGKPIDVVLRQRGQSDRIIESFMLVANETIAKHFKWLDLPFIYRVHENPKTDRLQKFSIIARTLGYTIKGSLEDIHSKELSKIIEASKGSDEHPIISTLLLRCMAKARYDEQCLGHFGLADEYYTHFTSPIRRYPDLMVHRLIRTYLFENKIDEETLMHFASIMQNVA
ncbi:MAG: ribonuclease R, partial [Faecalibacillus sp.]